MLPWIKCGVIRIFLMLFFLWKFLFWTLSIFKRGPDIRIFPTLSNFKNVNFIYTNFSRVRLDFIYSNAGWALFHANRSLFRIIWWNWKIMYNNYKNYYQYLKNEMKRHRPTAMIELSQRKQGEIWLENDGRGVPTYASDVFLRLSKIKCLEIEKP